MTILDPLFNPLLRLGPLWALIIISVLISLIVVLVYKFFTDQGEMKRLKEQQKEYQHRMKELRDKPEEMMKIQKEAMGKNFEYMKHSFKATLITMLPIIFIFSWMNAHLAFEPIYPGETYSITAKFKEGISGEAQLVVDGGTELLSPAEQAINSATTWNLKSMEGEHFVTVKAGNQEQTKKVLISKELRYEQPFSLFKHSDIERIQINYAPLKPLGHTFSLFGWQPGWLGLYIFFSIIFSIGLRKVMKVY